MSMLDMLRRTGGLSALSVRLDLTPTQSADIAGVFLPYLMGGFARAYRRSDDAAFVDRLQMLGGEAMAERVLIPGTIDPSQGDEALKLAFGSNSIRDSVQAVLNKAVAIDGAVCREAMRLLALLLGGYLISQALRVELGIAGGIEPALREGLANDPLAAIVDA